MIDPDGRDAIFDITRDKKGNITGVTIRAIVYIQGQGASADRATALNKTAASFFKSKTVDGVKVSFGVNYVYDESKTEKELNPGENLLTFTDQSESAEATKGRSHINGGSQGDVYDGNYIALSGTTGEIHKRGQSDRTVMHETFHLLGLSDYYYMQEGFGEVSVKNYIGDIMGKSREDLKTIGISENHYRAFANRAQNGFWGLFLNNFVNTSSVDVGSDGTLLYAPNYRYMGTYKDSKNYGERKLVPIE
jgi:hypothetical protein